MYVYAMIPMVVLSSGRGAVLFTNKWMGACLPTQTDGLIRLTLATLAADDHGDINVKLANVSNLNQCCEPTPWWRQ